jgi:hypothetical protein
MSASPSPRQTTRSTLTISIPPNRRDAFYQALLQLREDEARPFMSLSALVVSTVVKAAQQLHPPSTASESAP